jgi:hypothetical protein
LGSDRAGCVQVLDDGNANNVIWLVHDAQLEFAINRLVHTTRCDTRFWRYDHAPTLCDAFIDRTCNRLRGSVLRERRVLHVGCSSLKSVGGGDGLCLNTHDRPESDGAD